MNIAIIGLGSISGVHLDAISKSGQQLVAICDVDGEKMYQKDFEDIIDKQEDYTKLNTEDIEIVHICTPHNTHYEISKYFLDKKIHVICEKPLTLSVSELRELCELADKNNCKYGICLQNRCNISTDILQRTITKKGSPKGIKANVFWARDESYYKQGPWRSQRALAGGGALITQALHTLDLMLELGGPVEKVQKASIPSAFGDIESTMVVTLFFKNGTIGILHTTVDYFEDSPIEITLDYGENEVVSFSNGLIYEQVAQKLTKLYDETTQFNAKSAWGNSHKRLIMLFYEAVESNGKDYISAKSSIGLHQVLAQIYE